MFLKEFLRIVEEPSVLFWNEIETMSEPSDILLTDKIETMWETLVLYALKNFKEYRELWCFIF